MTEGSILCWATNWGNEVTWYQHKCWLQPSNARHHQRHGQCSNSLYHSKHHANIHQHYTYTQLCSFLPSFLLDVQQSTHISTYSLVFVWPRRFILDILFIMLIRTGDVTWELLQKYFITVNDSQRMPNNP